jgi:hypothetical protein
MRDERGRGASLTGDTSDGILKVVMDMVKYVQGVYRGGQIELEQKPEGIEEARVIVAFLTDANGQQPSAEEIAAAVSEQTPAAPPTRGVTVTVSPEVAKELYESRGKPHPFRPINTWRSLWLEASAETPEGQEDE